MSNEIQPPIKFWVSGWDTNGFPLGDNVIAVFITQANPGKNCAFQVIEYSYAKSLEAQIEKLQCEKEIAVSSLITANRFAEKGYAKEAMTTIDKALAILRPEETDV